MRTVSKSATFLATESVNSAPIKRGDTEVQFFWQGKAQNSSPLLRCTFLARRSAKLIANFSATMVTSLPSFSLSLSLSVSLSLSPNVPHAQYRKREVQFFWQGKAQNSSPLLRCTFLARRSAKLIANFSATMVTSLPSFSLSLCISLSLSHRMYLTHNIGSASALPIIQRERERKRDRRK